MRHLYTVTAKTCQAPFIQVEYRDLLESEAKVISYILTGGFHSVECISDTTGEVMQSTYHSCNFFVPVYSIPDCLQQVADKLYTK